MSSRTLLLVEDSPDDMELTTRALRKSGVEMQVAFAQDGAEAIDYLAHGASPAVILLDLKLPKIGGLELISHVRADPQHMRVPIVVFSSSSHPLDMFNSYRLGCNSYVSKPVDFARLLEVIRLIGIYWLDVNAPAPMPT